MSIHPSSKFYFTEKLNFYAHAKNLACPSLLVVWDKRKKREGDQENMSPSLSFLNHPLFSLVSNYQEPATG